MAINTGVRITNVALYWLSNIWSIVYRREWVGDGLLLPPKGKEMTHWDWDKLIEEMNKKLKRRKDDK